MPRALLALALSILTSSAAIADAAPKTAVQKATVQTTAATETATPETAVQKTAARDIAAEPAPEPPRASTDRPQVLPGVLAVVPGIALHGLGHWVAGDKQTAWKLLRYQLIGLGMAAASGVVLQSTGGSRYGNELSIPVLIAGAGLLVNSFVADVYGSVSAGTPHGYREPPDLSATLGYAYIHDPVFEYRNFSVARARLVLGDWRLRPELWTALDANNQRARADLAYTLLDNDEGEYLRLHSAFTYHNFGDDGFATFVGELAVHGRIEMRRLGESLAGSFSTASYGLGLQRTDYKAGELGADDHALLLAHFGYGFYLPASGELEAYYEHRRDTFTAGLSPSTRNGSGFLGHFGLRLQQPIHKRLTLHAQAEIGAALLLGAAVEISLESQP